MCEKNVETISVDREYFEDLIPKLNKENIRKFHLIVQQLKQIESSLQPHDSLD